jgi:cytochrome c oxidase subunit 3
MAVKANPLAEHFANLEQQHEANTLGMWIFLATELMFFGGLFTGYAMYRHWYPDEFAAASARLNLAYGTVNTVVLLTSSLTMALAVHAARAGRRDALTTWLVVTALLGALFLIIKGFEYHGDYADKLVPGLAFDDSDWDKPGRIKLFLLLYYLMTGVHAVHLMIGIGAMFVLAALAWRGRYSSTNYAPVEVGGLYWHFVDVIWIFLLPLLYLVGVRGIGGGP